MKIGKRFFGLYFPHGQGYTPRMSSMVELEVKSIDEKGNVIAKVVSDIDNHPFNPTIREVFTIKRSLIKDGYVSTGRLHFDLYDSPEGCEDEIYLYENRDKIKDQIHKITDATKLKAIAELLAK